MNSASSNLTNNATAASGAVSPTAGTPATPVPAAASTPVTVTAASNTTASAVPAVTASPTFSPLYQQIKALITQSLQSGEWKPGELIPSEVELAGRFKVSQGTVRKAIDELAAENLVMRRQGKGTFVSTHHEARAHFRFLRLVPDEGVPHYPESKFIEVKRVRAPADVARLMDLKSGDAVIFIKRVQYFDGVPTIVEELWLPGLIFKGLTAERLVEYKGPMYGLFETEFGTRMIRASEQIRAVCADAGAAQLLNIDLGTPLLSSERVSFTYGDKPVELRRGLYLTSRHHYQNELS
ncbi:putative HTH-type transcriptional regulator YurK [Janthinobacterium sp. HH103]|uniref:UTRA domain-containing protein n=1 Tax=Janthinobacterium agaricidamnosum TaxID=55508 RepID=A0A3G2ECR5_9BURK|nr:MULTISPECIES: GntR family transcriptional regulator [Janthinobacterium]AYM77650.1 UTRA domain-containing protein [Janthinobacterium agaricidamnosum]OEZ64626.1 putative HTH-type transcriptional regulator YurK [Janthinobacterium sp. HH100]OEZ84114.1 putative HTH-type transcriptional regulator YurK [Janthinobacterium sp. HH103]OFA08634.1 putative HTH-type transcriptional regulator YurK [Janthinobacterium sp. HH107]QOU74883.1 UTRA domain protein [Janthinobacterium sp. HH102]